MTADPLRRAFESGRYPDPKLFATLAYDVQKAKLQAELLKVQIRAQDTGQKFVVPFEGCDAAGKSGTIKRFAEHLNPRHTRIVALTTPSGKETGQRYFQRYIKQLPTAGEMVLHDPSWFTRAGVERLMGFCTPTGYLEFMRQAPAFGRMLVQSGIRLFKFWRSVARNEQRARLGLRETDPLKGW